jgi:hypothetical protein
LRLEKSARIELTGEDWQRAGEKAKELGKEICAEVAFGRIERNSLEENKGKGGGKG